MLPWLKANLKNFDEEGCWKTFKDGQFSLFSFEKKNMLLVGGECVFFFRAESPQLYTTRVLLCTLGKRRSIIGCRIWRERERGFAEMLCTVAKSRGRETPYFLRR
jgi:acyl-CoA thioesterase FadM